MEVQTEKVQLQKYPTYKSSGVKWLGQIPEPWGFARMRYLFRDVSIKNRSEECLLSVTQNQGVVPRDWVENRMVMPSGNLESFKYIEEGDFAISLRSFEGGLEYCYHDGIISPAYTVLKMKKGLIAAYYKYLFKSRSFISEIQTSVVGIREGKNISYPELSYSILPIPSHPEQTAIATFLDDKTSKIDQAIAQKQKLIELLKERKQILIQQAVTKGLNPHAKMKDSGVKWIGEIPEGWKFTKLGHYIDILSGFAFPSNGFSSDQGVRLLRGINITVGRIRWDDLVFWPANKLQKLDIYFLAEGDIVFGMDRPLITGGMRIAIIKKDDQPCLLLQRVARIRAQKKMYQNYLVYLFRSKSFMEYFSPILSGVSVPHISPDQIRNFKIGIPELEVQRNIVTYIETQSAKIDKAIGLQQQQIEKLKEYKATLIDAAVTGKIKVG